MAEFNARPFGALVRRMAVVVLAGAALAGCVYYPSDGYYSSGYYGAPAVSLSLIHI